MFHHLPAHFPNGFEREVVSVEGDISRWMASVSELWSLWLPRELHACRWETSAYLMWPLLAEIENFVIIFPKISASQSLSYVATFKDNPFKRKQCRHTGLGWQTSRVTITSPKVNIYHHSQTGPFISSGRRGEGSWLLRSSSSLPMGLSCVFDTSCDLLLDLGYALHGQTMTLSQLAVPTELCISSKNSCPNFSTTAPFPTGCDLGPSLLGRGCHESSCASTKSKRHWLTYSVMSLWF